MMRSFLIAAQLATVTAQDVAGAKYTNPEYHAYPDAAKDLKTLMEGVRAQTDNVTFGHRHDASALRTMSALERRVHLGAEAAERLATAPRRGAQLGMASVDSLMIESAEIKDQRAQSWMEGLKRWRKAGKPAEAAASTSSDDDLELPDDDDENAAYKAKW